MSRCSPISWMEGIPRTAARGELDDATATGVGRAYQARIPGCHLAFVYAAGAPIAAERAEAFTEIVDLMIPEYAATAAKSLVQHGFLLLLRIAA